MGEPVDVAGAENKTAAQLERVSSQFVLRMTGRFGAGTGLGVVTSQQMKQVCALEFHGGIGVAFLVNKKRKSNPCFITKCTCIDAVAESHRGQSRAAIAEGLLMRAQLRDVLAAEDSTIVAQEYNHRWLVDP